MKKISYILLSILLLVLLFVTYTKAESLFFKASKSSASKDETVNIVLNLNDITYDRFNVTITSSDNISKLETNDIVINDIVNNEISFDIDKLSFDNDKISFTYKISSDAQEGDTIVFSAKITEINDENNGNSTIEYATITVIKNNDDNKPGNNTTNTSKPNMNSTKKVSTNTFSFKKTGETVTYNGSDNNYLNSLSVKGYSLNKKFTKESNTYFVTVKNNTKKITVNYKKSSSKSKVVITGNTNLKVGVNKVLVTVNAENGSSRVYRIYVTREGEA